MIDVKNAISIIENEKECVQSDCNRDCSRCELVKEESEIVDAFILAIRSLKSWEEVMTKLEEETEDLNLHYVMGIEKAIDIINQKLVEIKEVR